MKRVIKCLIFVLLMLPCFVLASENDINLYLFYGDGCPHCAHEEEFLNEYISKHNNVHLYSYEVWNSEENRTKFIDVKELLNNTSNGVPFLVIGNNAIVGYSSETTPESITNTINYYLKTDYKDIVGEYLGLVTNDDKKEEVSSEPQTDDKKDNKYESNDVNIPILGKINAKNVSLFFTTIIIGLVDGFNPCAMWILIFLISMLLGMENKKRMWALGIVFLCSSAIVYFLFLISWLNLTIFLDKIPYIRAGISMIAIIFGTYSLLKFVSSFNKDNGCEVVDSKNRKKIILSIKKIIKEKSFFLALIGVIILAASVNVIELLCSLGLPVAFTQIMTINEASGSSKIMYSLLYVLFFLIDDIIVFIVAMKTLQIKAISNKYGKYSHLIGGIIMLIIGILMLVKPEWLMFNF